jgi:formamidopyrimidine-DNA glycosylase
MPELPEVETVCRGLVPILVGQRIVRAEVRREGLRKPFPRGLKARLVGAGVTHIARRAKYILIHLDNGFVLVIHLGMSGRVLFYPRDYRPQTHDHFILHMQDGQQIVLNDPRRFGVVDLVPVEALDTHVLFAHLGPEPLGNDFSAPRLEAALKNRKTAIKQAIMDQGVVVGVGNIYASEALFLSGINPKRAANRVNLAQAEKLVAAIRTVLKKAIKAGGSTLRDHRQANGELGYFQHSFTVYDRAGQSCPGCDCDIDKTGGIKKIVQGGRSSFYCPRKQK